MLKSTVQWRDLTDGHLYSAGDPFPWDGREIPEERINALKSSQNKAGFAVIKAVEEPGKTNATKAEETAEKAEKTAEKQATKTTRKPRTTKAK